jgi:tetratricopeptide (TPR) repeat protein
MRRSSKTNSRMRAERYIARARELYVGAPGETGFVNYDLSKALINAKRAIILDPNNYAALVLLGKIVGEQDESENGLRTALDYYDKAISVNPNIPDAYQAKGIALFDAQKFRLALEPNWRAWRLTRSDPNSIPFDIEVASIYLRDTLVKLGRWRFARNVLESALGQIPDSPPLLRLLDLTIKHIECAPDDLPQPPRVRRVK